MATTSPPQVVLVTGGTGLVGNALRSVVAADPSKEHATWIFLGRKDCDLIDAVATKALFERYKPTHVIHLAAHVGGLFANLTSNLEFYEDNMRINDSVLAACVAHRVKLVSCLSTCIFPDKSAYPIDETMVHNGPPHASNEGYSYAKRMLEVHSRLCRTAFGLDFVTVVPTNVYGPYDQFNLSQSHVVPGLIHKCYLAKLHSTPLIVGGTGKPLRQFIFSHDLARLILWTLHNYSAPEPLILSCDEDAEVSIGDVARMIADAMKFSGDIVFDKSLPDGQFKKTASNARLRAVCGDANVLAFASLREGIETTVQWFIANVENARR